MFAALGLSDNQKVGLMMTGLGLAFLLLGMLLLFDSGLLAIGNVLFLVGLALLVGVPKFLEFFNPMRKKGKPRGVACFVLGVLLVLWRWSVVGMLLELFGLFEMFGTFLPIVFDTLGTVPVVGPFLKLPPVARVVDFISGRRPRPRPPV
jgi:hypothetical protein